MSEGDTDIYDELRALVNRYTAPCVEACEHSQCPLLREIQVLMITHSLRKAQSTVKPIVDLEQAGESIGDLMDLRLRRDGILDLDLDPFRRRRVGREVSQ